MKFNNILVAFDVVKLAEPIDSELDYSRPDAGETDKDLHTQDKPATGYENVESKAPELVRLKAPKKAVKVASFASRYAELLTGKRAGPLFNTALSDFIKTKMPQFASPAATATSKASMNAASAELAKVLGTQGATVGGLGVGAYQIREANKPKSRVAQIKSVIANTLGK